MKEAVVPGDTKEGKIFVRDNDRKLAMEIAGIRVKIGSAVHVVELGAGKSEIIERKRKASVGS